MQSQIMASVSPPAIVSAVDMLKPTVAPLRRSIARHLIDVAARMAGLIAGFSPTSWVLIDAGIIVAALREAYDVFPPPAMLDTPHIALWQACSIFVLGFTLSGLSLGVYERDTLLSRSRIITRLLLACAITFALAYCVIYVVMYATVARKSAVLALALFFVITCSVRMAANWAMCRVYRRLVVVGSAALYNSFVQAQHSGHLSEYRLVGFTRAGTLQSADEADQENARCLGDISDWYNRFAELGITDVVVGNRAATDPNMMSWLVPCLQSGCRVTNEAIFYEKATGQVLVDEITPEWFLFADLKVHCDKLATVKRLADIVLSLTGFFLTLPLWPIIALAIKLQDGGPIFYSQLRIGQHGNIFRLYKFRTMLVNAEQGQSIWATAGDPRVTRIGRLLRQSRLDELPQLYNILVGQMSFVGPRPERPDIVQDLTDVIPWYNERHLVKPGLTGWAQISFRYGASIDDSRRKLQFDLYYLKNMSLELDMMIIMRTICTFLQGAR